MSVYTKGIGTNRYISHLMSQQGQGRASTAAPAGTPVGSPFRTAGSTGGAVGATAITIRHPNEMEFNNICQEFMYHLREDKQPENTKKTYIPKVKEFVEFLQYQYGNQPFPLNLTADKIYRFFFFLTFREQKKRGGRNPESSGFDAVAYEEVMKQFRDRQAAGNINYLDVCEDYKEPENPVSFQIFVQYKAVVRRIYQLQLARGAISFHWDQLWLPDTTALYRHVQQRQPEVDKSNYKEKINAEFSPYLIVEQYPLIEQELWNDSNKSGYREVCTNLRHRMCMLYLTSGILRCESLHRAELSDFLCFNVPKRDQDIHRMFIMLNQIPKGKTNKGRILYGRATRHRDVRLCAVGAMTMYLQCRFLATHEFKDFTTEDWCDNSKWFDTKLLVDVNGADHTKEMRNDSYSRHMKKILKKLKIASKSLCHLGRKLGAKILELLEEEMEELKRMGQWNPSTFDNHYSAKFPLSAIRKLAGFPDKLYYNTRTVVDVPQELLERTPIGKWAYKAFDDLSTASLADVDAHQTAFHFLKFVCKANEIFLQDAAAFAVSYPDRMDHNIYNWIEAMQMEGWKVRSEEDDAYFFFGIEKLISIIFTLGLRCNDEVCFG